MKKLLGFLLLCISALAQNTVTVTAANIHNGSSGLLSSGTILFQAVNSSGQNISYQVGGSGPSFTLPIVCAITNGAITGPACILPNVSVAIPQNFCFAVTVKNTSNLVVLGGPGSAYQCLQPVANSSWCSSAICNFDLFYPTIPNQVFVIGLPPPSSSGPGGVFSGTCSLGSVVFGYDATGHLVCVSVFPANPQVGDTLRFNVNGDGLWDSANYAQQLLGVYAVWGSSPQSFGIFGSGTVSTIGNNTTDVNPTSTFGSGKNIGQTAGASTSTVIGFSYGANGNNSRIGMQAFYRFSARLSVNSLSNARYWFGLATFANAGTGNNGTAIVGTTAYATNTPNKSTEGFRCAAGTDTTWQAVAITAGAGSGSQTTVSTTVNCDTAVHLFEMTPNAAGTSILYWIDGTNVATISTNLPPPANGANSWGDLFLVGDNENTATAISATIYTMQISLKQ